MSVQIMYMIQPIRYCDLFCNSGVPRLFQIYLYREVGGGTGEVR